MDISKSKIKINYDKSHGSYLYDLRTQTEFLDLMSMYSSLPIGYNHPIFDTEEYQKTIIKYSKVKTCNCEYSTEEKELFEKSFLEFAGLNKYDFAHFCSAGAIAVELAIKAAIDISNKPNGKVIYFSNSFHGILGYSNFITDRVGGTKQRLENFMNINDWFMISDLSELEKTIQENFNEIACVIIEPIRCTQGDLYYSNEDIIKIFEISKKYNIITISDEIQTGFGSTGKIWYTDDLADIIVFGKKVQVSGFLTTKEFGDKLNPLRYCVTWDGDVLDMIRGRFILETIKKYDLLNNVKNLGQYFIDELTKIKSLKNVRGLGFIIAFDLESEHERNKFYQKCLDNKLLVNLTGINSIRIRPNLNFTKKDIDESIKKIKLSL